MGYPTIIGETHPTRGWRAEERKCRSCGTSFLGWSSCHDYCPACPASKRWLDPKVSRTCASCGDDYMGHARRGKFCDICITDRKLQKAESRNCIQCGKAFRPGWTRRAAKLCSRYCQGLWINANDLGPRHNDSELEAKLIAIIKGNSASMTKEELCHAAGITGKVLKGRKWTVDGLYKKAGVVRKRPLLGSQFEDRVFSVLRDLFPSMTIETQKRFDGWLGLRGGQLTIDFFLPDLNLAIEADGNQHASSRGGMYPTEKIQKHDRIKDALAVKDGVHLLRIPQTVNKTVIRNKIVRILPLLTAKSAANFLNCWDGGESLPISSQASKEEGPTTIALCE